MKLFGIQLNVPDIRLAQYFYCEHFGFTVENDSHLPEILHLEKDGVRIILLQVMDLPEQAQDTTPHYVLNLETDNLAAEMARLQQHADVRIMTPEIQQCSVASYISVLDPFNNSIHIVQLHNE